MDEAVATEVKLVLPAVDIPDSVTLTTAGGIIVPGQRLPERHIPINVEFVRILLETARASARNAYAPYSRFHVGAAVVMADDPEQFIHAGANVENSSYGGTLCGERSALFHATSRGFRKLRYLALSTPGSLTKPLSDRSPCGMCRQAIREFASRDGNQEALIFVDTGRDDTLCEVFDIDRLLPYGFSFAPPDGNAG